MRMNKGLELWKKALELSYELAMGYCQKDLKDTRQIFGLHIMIMLKDVRLLI